MQRICLIVVWMGRLPSYFPLWLRTLPANTGYDFLLVTDQKVEAETPSNLRVIEFSLEGLRKYIASRLSLEPGLQHPYKLCDFKPAYGEIFEEYIDGYAYWGCCDLDMLFGDLKTFITPELLGSYRKLFSRGHLTLYRNEPLVNTAYRRSQKIDYRYVFTNSPYFQFDEWSGVHRIFEELGIEQYNKEIMADIKVYSSRLAGGNIPNHSPQIFVWQSGKAGQYFIQGGKVETRELAYIHFQKRKIVIHDDRVYSSSAMILNPQSVVPYEGTITADVIRKFDKPGYGHYFQSQIKRIKKKINPPKNGLSIDKTFISAKF